MSAWDALKTSARVRLLLKSGKLTKAQAASAAKSAFKDLHPGFQDIVRGAAPQALPSAPTNVVSQIYGAYKTLSGGRLNQRVPLSELRKSLPTIPKDKIDDALREIHLKEGATLSGENNPQALNKALKEGQLDFKGNPQYYLWITKPMKSIAGAAVGAGALALRPDEVMARENTNMTTEQQIGALVKKKYPQYANVPDDQLGALVLKKYPQYAQAPQLQAQPAPAQQLPPMEPPVFEGPAPAPPRAPVFTGGGTPQPAQQQPTLDPWGKAKADLIAAAESATKPIRRLGPAIAEEAHAGVEGLRQAFTERRAENPLTDIALRGVDALGSAARVAAPQIGGAATAISGDPIGDVTGSETARAIATYGLPIGAFAVSRIPQVMKAIESLPPAAQVLWTQLGGDAPAVPSVANMVERKAKLRAARAAGGPPLGNVDDVAKAAGGPALGSVDDVAATASRTAKGKAGASIAFDDLVGDDFVVGSNVREKLADIVQNKFKFKLTYGERTGSRRWQQLETANEALPLGSLQKIRESNRKQLNWFVTKRIGKATPEIDDAWLNSTRAALSDRFDSLGKESGPIQTSEFLEKAKSVIPGPIQKAEKARIEGTLRTIQQEYGGVITPEQYGDIRSQLAKVARNNDVSNPDLARRYRMLSDTLDDAIEESAGTVKRKEWAEVRGKWKDYLILEDSVDRGSGLIDPNKFARAVEKSYRKGIRVGIGENEMIDLATALRTFRNQIPTSGTAERSAGIEQLRRGMAGGMAMGDLATLGTTAAGSKAFKEFTLRRAAKMAKKVKK